MVNIDRRFQSRKRLRDETNESGVRKGDSAGWGGNRSTGNGNNSSNSRGGGSGNGGGGADGHGVKMRRLNTTASVEAINITTSKPELQDAYARPEVVNRNRRLLGSLMGHLDHARKKLESDSALIHRQQERLQVVTQKHMSESQRLSEEVKLKRLQKKLEQDVRAVEAETRKQQQQLRQRRHSIRTLATPSIAWAPGRHNAVTINLLNEHQAEVRDVAAQTVLCHVLYV